MANASNSSFLRQYNIKIGADTTELLNKLKAAKKELTDKLNNLDFSVLTDAVKKDMEKVLEEVTNATELMSKSFENIESKLNVDGIEKNFTNLSSTVESTVGTLKDTLGSLEESIATLNSRDFTQLGGQISQSFNEVNESVGKVLGKIVEVTVGIKEYQEVLRDVRSGKITMNIETNNMENTVSNVENELDVIAHKYSDVISKIEERLSDMNVPTDPREDLKGLREYLIVLNNVIESYDEFNNDQKRSIGLNIDMIKKQRSQISGLYEDGIRYAKRAAIDLEKENLAINVSEKVSDMLSGAIEKGNTDEIKKALDKVVKFLGGLDFGEGIELKWKTRIDPDVTVEKLEKELQERYIQPIQEYLNNPNNELKLHVSIAKQSAVNLRDEAMKIIHDALAGKLGDNTIGDLRKDIVEQQAAKQSGQSSSQQSFVPMPGRYASQSGVSNSNYGGINLDATGLAQESTLSRIANAVEKWDSNGIPTVSRYPKKEENITEKAINKAEQLLAGRSLGNINNPIAVDAANVRKETIKRIGYYEQRNDMIKELAKVGVRLTKKKDIFTSSAFFNEGYTAKDGKVYAKWAGLGTPVLLEDWKKEWLKVLEDGVKPLTELEKRTIKENKYNRDKFTKEEWEKLEVKQNYTITEWLNKQLVDVNKIKEGSGLEYDGKRLIAANETSTSYGSIYSSAQSQIRVLQKEILEDRKDENGNIILGLNTEAQKLDILKEERDLMQQIIGLSSTDPSNEMLPQLKEQLRQKERHIENQDLFKEKQARLIELENIRTENNGWSNDEFYEYENIKQLINSLYVEPTEDMLEFALKNVEVIDAAVTEQQAKVEALQSTYNDRIRDITIKFYKDNNVFTTDSGQQIKLLVNDDADYRKKVEELKVGRATLSAMEASMYRGDYEDYGALYNDEERKQYSQLKYRMDALGKAVVFYQEMRKKQGVELEKIKEFVPKKVDSQGEEVMTLAKALKPMIESGLTENEYLRTASQEEFKQIVEDLLKVEDSEYDVQQDVITALEARIQYLNKKKIEVDKDIKDAKAAGRDTIKLEETSKGLGEAVAGLSADKKNIEAQNKLTTAIKSTNNLNDKEFDQLMRIVDTFVEKQNSKNRLDFLDKKLSPLSEVDYNNFLKEFNERMSVVFDLDEKHNAQKITDEQYNALITDAENKVYETIAKMNPLPEDVPIETKDKLNNIIYQIAYRENSYKTLSEALQQERKNRANLIKAYEEGKLVDPKTGDIAEDYFRKKDQEYVDRINEIVSNLNSILDENDRLMKDKSELLSGYRTSGKAFDQYTAEKVNSQKLDKQLEMLIEEALGSLSGRIKDKLGETLTSLISEGKFHEGLKEGLDKGIDSIIAEEGLGKDGKIFKEQLDEAIDSILEEGLTGYDLEKKLSDKFSSIINKNFYVRGGHLKGLLKNGVEGLLSNDLIYNLINYKLTPTGKATTNITNSASTRVSESKQATEILNRILHRNTVRTETEKKRSEERTEERTRAEVKKEETKERFNVSSILNSLETMQNEIYENIDEKKLMENELTELESLSGSNLLKAYDKFYESKEKELEALDQSEKDLLAKINSYTYSNEGIEELVNDILNNKDGRYVKRVSNDPRVPNVPLSKQELEKKANEKRTELYTEKNKLNEEYNKTVEDNKVKRQNIEKEIADERSKMAAGNAYLNILISEREKLKKFTSSANETESKIKKIDDELNLIRNRAQITGQIPDEIEQRRSELLKEREILQSSYNYKIESKKDIEDKILSLEEKILHGDGQDEINNRIDVIHQDLENLQVRRDFIRDSYKSKAGDLITGSGEKETKESRFYELNEALKHYSNSNFKIERELWGKAGTYLNSDDISDIIFGQVGAKYKSRLGAEYTITEDMQSLAREFGKNEPIISNLTKALRRFIPNFDKDVSILGGYDDKYTIKPSDSTDAINKNTTATEENTESKSDATTATAASTDEIKKETEEIEKNTKAKQKNQKVTNDILKQYGVDSEKSKNDQEIIQGILDSTYDEDQFDLDNVRRSTPTYIAYEKRKLDLQKDIDTLKDEKSKAGVKREKKTDTALSDLIRQKENVEKELERMKDGFSQKEVNNLEILYNYVRSIYSPKSGIINATLDGIIGDEDDIKAIKEKANFFENQFRLYSPQNMKQRYESSDELKGQFKSYKEYSKHMLKELNKDRGTKYKSTGDYLKDLYTQIKSDAEFVAGSYKYNNHGKNPDNVIRGLRSQLTTLENNLHDLQTRNVTHGEAHDKEIQELESKIQEKRDELREYEEGYEQYSIQAKEKEIADLNQRINNEKTARAINVSSSGEQDAQKAINNKRRELKRLEAKEKSIGLADPMYLKAVEENEKRKEKREEEENRHAHMTEEEKKLTNDLYEANGKLINMLKDKDKYTEKQIDDQKKIIRGLEEQVELSERLELYERGQYNNARLKSQYRPKQKLSSSTDEPFIDIDPTIPATEKTLVEIRDILYKTIGKNLSRPKQKTEDEREHSEFFKKYGVEYNKYLIDKVAKDLGLMSETYKNGVKVKYIDKDDRETVNLEYARRIKERNKEIDKIAEELGLFKKNKAGEKYLTSEGRRRAIVEMENRSPGSSMYQRHTIDSWRKEFEKDPTYKIGQIKDARDLIKTILLEDAKGNDVSKLFSDLMTKFGDQIGVKKEVEDKDSLTNQIKDIMIKMLEADSKGEDTSELFKELLKKQEEVNSLKVESNKDGEQSDSTAQTEVKPDLKEEIKGLLQQFFLKDALGEDTSDLFKQLLQKADSVLGNEESVLSKAIKSATKSNKVGELDTELYKEIAKRNGWYYENTLEDGTVKSGVKSDFRKYVYGQMEIEKAGSSGYSDEVVKENVKEYLMYLLAKGRDGALTKAGTTRASSKKELEKELVNIKPGFEGLTEEQLTRVNSILGDTATTLSQVAQSSEQVASAQSNLSEEEKLRLRAEEQQQADLDKFGNNNAAAGSLENQTNVTDALVESSQQATAALSEQDNANRQVAESSQQATTALSEQTGQQTQTSSEQTGSDIPNELPLPTGEVLDFKKLLEEYKMAEPILDKYGKKTVEKFYNGALAETDDEKKAFEEIAKIPKEVIATYLDMHSPSKVMEVLGYNTIEGFAKGIEENADRVSEAMAYALQEGKFTQSDINDLLGSLDRRKKSNKIVGDFIDSKRYESDEIKQLLQADMTAYGELKSSILSQIKDKNMNDIAKIIRDDTDFVNKITDAETALKNITNGQATFENVFADIFGNKSHKTVSEAYTTAIRKMTVGTGELNETIAKVVNNLGDVETASEEAFDVKPVKEQINGLRSELGNDLNVKEKTRKAKKGNKKSYKIEGENGTATISESGEVSITKKTINDLDKKRQNDKDEKENERKTKDAKRKEFDEIIDAAKAVVIAEREVDSAFNKFKKDNNAFAPILAEARVNLDKKKEELAKFDVEKFLKDNSKYLTKKQMSAYDSAIRKQRTLEDTRLASQQSDFNATVNKNQKKADAQHAARVNEDAEELKSLKTKSLDYEYLIQKATGEKEKKTLKRLKADVDSIFETKFASYGKEVISVYDDKIKDVESRHIERMALEISKNDDKLDKLGKKNSSDKSVQNARELLDLQKEIYRYEIMRDKAGEGYEKDALNKILAQKNERFLKLFSKADKATVKEFNKGYGSIYEKHNNELYLLSQKNKDKEDIKLRKEAEADNRQFDKDREHEINDAKKVRENAYVKILKTMLQISDATNQDQVDNLKQLIELYKKDFNEASNTLMKLSTEVFNESNDKLRLLKLETKNKRDLKMHNIQEKAETENNLINKKKLDAIQSDADELLKVQEEIYQTEIQIEKARGENERNYYKNQLDNKKQELTTLLSQASDETKNKFEEGLVELKKKHEDNLSLITAKILDDSDARDKKAQEGADKRQEKISKEQKKYITQRTEKGLWMDFNHRNIENAYAVGATATFKNQKSDTIWQGELFNKEVDELISSVEEIVKAEEELDKAQKEFDEKGDAYEGRLDVAKEKLSAAVGKYRDLNPVEFYEGNKDAFSDDQMSRYTKVMDKWEKLNLDRDTRIAQEREKAQKKFESDAKNTISTADRMYKTISNLDESYGITSDENIAEYKKNIYDSLTNIGKTLKKELYNTDENDNILSLKNIIDINTLSKIDELTSKVHTLGDEIERINKQEEIDSEINLAKSNVGNMLNNLGLYNSDEYRGLVLDIVSYINNIDMLKRDDNGLFGDVEINNAKNYLSVIKNIEKEANNIPQLASEISKSKISAQMSDYLRKNTRINPIRRNELELLMNQLDSKSLDQQGLKNIIQRFNELKVQINQAGEAGKGFAAIFNTKMVHIISAQVAQMFSFYSILNRIRSAINVIVDLDNALVDLQKTTKMNTSDLNDFYYEANNISIRMGVTTKEIIEQASAWSRLGYNTKDAAEQMAELNSQFASISPGMDINTATDGLVSSMKAFNIEVEDVERRIMDNINRVGNTAATSNQEIVDMLTRSSAAMAAANNSIEETIALETAAVEITRNAETTGTAFKTIAMRIRGYDEETEELSEDLETISGDIASLTKINGKGGISLFTDDTKQTYKSTYQILKEISEIYDDLTDKQRAELLEKLAGKRGGQVVAGLLTNFDAVEKALNEMDNAAGSSDDEMRIIEKSISYKINALKETWTGVFQDIVERDDIGSIITALTSLSSALGNFIRLLDNLKFKIGNVTGNNPLINMLGLGNVTIGGNNALGGILGLGAGAALGTRNLGVIRTYNVSNDDGTSSLRIGTWLNQRKNIVNNYDKKINKNKKLLEEAKGVLQQLQEYFGDSNTLERIEKYKKGVEDVGSAFNNTSDELKNYVLQHISSDNIFEDFIKETVDTTNALEEEKTEIVKTSGAMDKLAKTVRVGLNALVSMGLGMLIDTALGWVQEYLSAEETIREKARDAGKAISETSESVEDYKKQINDLYKVIKDKSSTDDQVIEARTTLLELQNQMIEKYGDETSKIESVTKATLGYVDALDQLTTAQYYASRNDFEALTFGEWVNNTINAYSGNMARMKDEFLKTRTEAFYLDISNADFSKFDENMINELNKIGVKVKLDTKPNLFQTKTQGLKKYGIGVNRTSGLAELSEYTKNANLVDFDPLTQSLSASDRIVLQFTGDARQLNTTVLQMQEIFGDIDGFDGAINQLGIMQNDLDGIISSFEKMADAYVYEELIMNKNDKMDLESLPNNITNAVKEYNEAFKNNDKKAMDQATIHYLGSIKSSEKYLNDQIANGKISEEDAQAVMNYLENMYSSQMQGAIDTLELHLKVVADLYPTVSKDSIKSLKDNLSREDLISISDMIDTYENDGQDLQEVVSNAMESARAKIIEQGLNPEDMDSATQIALNKAIDDAASELGMTTEMFLSTYYSAENGINGLLQFCKENGYELEQLLDELGFKSREVSEEETNLTSNIAEKVNTARKSLESLYDSLEKYRTGKLVGGDYLDVLEDVLKEDSEFLEGANNIGEALQNAINKKLEETRALIVQKAPELLDAWDEAIDKAQFTSKLNEANTELDKLQEGMKTLSSAFDEYNESGFITLDTLQSLMAENGEYIQMLTIENGQLKINEEAYKNIMAAKLNDFKATLDKAAAAEINALAEENAEGKTRSNIQALNEETIAYSENTREAIKNATKKGVSEDEINNIINKYDTIWDTALKGYNKNFKQFSGLANSSAKDAQTKAKELLDNYIAVQDALLDAGKISFADYCKNVKGKLDEMYNSGKISAKDYFDSVKTFLEKQQSIYDKILNAVTRRFDKEIEGIDKQITAINEENDALNKQKDEYDKILSVVQEVYDKEIESLQNQQEAIQDKIDALQKANDEEDRALALANARYALEKAQQQRTRLVYNGAEGFVYQTDPEAIRDAKKELKDVELENTISALEEEKEALDKNIEALEEYKEKWSEVSGTYDKEVNRQLAIALWGENYEQMILQNREQDIQDFTDKYVELQKKVDDNTSLIESLEEKKQVYEELKKEWQDITSVYEQSIEDQLAAEYFGADWESQILSGRKATLEQFKDAYISIQEQIREAALRSAEAQEKAAAAGSGNTGSIPVTASDTSTQNKVRNVSYLESDEGVIQEIDDIKEYVKTHARDLQNPYVRIKTEDITGYGVYDEKDKNYKKQVKSFETLGEALKFVDENKERKWKIRAIQAFAKGGVINANNNNPLNSIASKLGEDTAVLARHGERILTPVQNQYWEKWTNAIPNLTKHLEKLKFNTPNLSSILNAVASKETTVKQEISISLPNVTNTSGAEYVLNALKTLPLEAVQRVNRR